MDDLAGEEDEFAEECYDEKQGDMHGLIREFDYANAAAESTLKEKISK